MSLKRRITRVEDQRFTSADRFSVLKNDGSCPAALSRPQPAMELQKKHSFALLSRSSLSPSPFLVSLPLGFRSIGVEERRATTKRKEFWNNDEEGEGQPIMTGRRKNSQLTWASRCRVGVIGFAENFYVFSRHLHNVRGEHGRSIG